MLKLIISFCYFKISFTFMIDLIPNSQAVQYQVLEMYLYIPSGTSYFNSNLVSFTQHSLVFFSFLS